MIPVSPAIPSFHNQQQLLRPCRNAMNTKSMKVLLWPVFKLPHSPHPQAPVPQRLECSPGAEDESSVGTAARTSGTCRVLCRRNCRRNGCNTTLFETRISLRRASNRGGSPENAGNTSKSARLCPNQALCATVFPCGAYPRDIDSLCNTLGTCS